MNQEKLNALISSKKPEKRSRIRMHFRGRQKLGTQNGTRSKPSQVQTTDAATPTTAGGIAATDTPHVVSQKKNGRCRSCLPDGGSRIPDFEENNRTGEDTGFLLLQKLFCHTKEDRGTHTSPLPTGVPIWTFPQPPHIHQSSSPDIDMDENTWDTNLGIFERSTDPRREEGSLKIKLSHNLFQACKTRLQDQAREIEYENMSVDKPPGNGYQFSECDA
ncbi:hypothetical protein AYI69_g8593 [Smittium culicis]|uniref:Uncharacterized protein n=1 Tax=Smittium culicis TaxID=133412 RepID=A0A1R1XIP9_9FUNG|nr:hypothetical protein AYI69_g8593 [Smittium culicis]